MNGVCNMNVFILYLCCVVKLFNGNYVILLSYLKKKKETLFFDMYYFSTYILILIKGNDLCVECFKYFT